MSRDVNRKSFYNRPRDWDRNSYRNHEMPTKRSRSPNRDKRRSRSPRKSDKDLDENILSEISKLPEPNELWDNQFQDGFSGNSSAPPPPSFSQEGTSYPSSYQPPYSSGYDEFPSHSQNATTWNQGPMRAPPPSQQSFVNVEDQIKKDAGIQSEVRHQRAAFCKQREDCLKKISILKKELETLKDQRNELHNNPKRSPSPDTNRFLKENTKLQLEIQNKLKTINSVVDILNGMIGEEAQTEKTEGDPGERSSKRKSRSPSNKKFNYVYYDPEMHWCRVCNEFPATAKDYLTHLHSPSHHKMASAHMEAPWHSVSGVNEGFPNYASAPTKRTPIRGLQFFVPSTAWYCKLCDQFIGDLHCASAHLKSVIHSKNYTNFVEQNPHWDTDWMSDRQKAFEKSRGKGKGEEKPQYAAHTITFNKDGFHTKRKDSPPPVSGSEKKRKKEKRKKKTKKKRSSSESSSSSSSDSEVAKKPKKKKEAVIDDKALSEWISSIPLDTLNYSERKLLDNLKSRAEQVKERRKSRSHDERRMEERREERQERRDERREERQERRDERKERNDRPDRRAERRNERPRSGQSSEPKKPEIKKMPFIGKMPVFKNLGKNTKIEEPNKEEEEKKKQEEEVNKKRREEMDAEIQKKVAQFKEKIAKAQLEKQQLELAPPLPFSASAAANLGFLPPPTLINPPMPPPQAPNNLPKDFQDALDIIFPSSTKSADLQQQEMFVPGLGGFPVPMPAMPYLGLVQPPQMVMGFDVNSQLYQPAPQLYDTHVPIAPANQTPKPEAKEVKSKEAKESTANRNKEQMDELAMLGIDASDVASAM